MTYIQVTGFMRHREIEQETEVNENRSSESCPHSRMSKTWDRWIVSGHVRVQKIESLNLLPVELLLNSEELSIHIYACRAYDEDKSWQIETGHALLFLPLVPQQANSSPLSHYSSLGPHPPFFHETQESGQKEVLIRE